MAVEPVHPMERFKPNRLVGFRGRSAVDQLRVVQTIDRLGQGFVVAIAATSYRRLAAHLGQPLAISNAAVLGSAIRVMDEQISVRLPRVESPLQSGQDKVCLPTSAHPPPN